ncbi:ferredoxin [Kitasatospora sp. NPDC056783]|uniref:ferredoxin n=1 Tax=Kitasatospora sp. NPDC056783 TaxID=3345943 RepID=UPI0036BEB494
MTRTNEPPGRSPHAHVDPDACIGSGICLATAPRHFERAPAPDTRSRARPDAPPPDDEARSAAELCPVEAIRFTAARPPVT